MTNTSPTAWRGDATLLPPLVNANPTAKTYIWNFTLTNATGTFYNLTTTSSGQNVYYSTYLGATVANTSVGYSGDGIQWNSTLTKASPVTVYNISAIFNNKIYTPTLSGSTYYASTSYPPVSTDTFFYPKYTMTINYGGDTLLRESTNTTVTSVTVNLTNCASGYPIYKFQVFDEESNEALTQKFEAFFKVYSDYANNIYSSFNFTYNGNHTHYICMSPNTTSITVDADIKYYNATELYPERYYFLRGARATNATNSINLYSLNSTYASNIKFQVINPNSRAESDVVLNVQRYYEGAGTSKTVAMGLTDDNGYTNIRLRAYDVYYTITALKNGVILKTFAPMIISSDSNILIVPSEIVGDYWKYHDQIGYSCNADSATYILRCDGTVTDGTSLNFHLNAWWMRPTSREVVCEESVTGSAVTLLCNIGDWTDKNIQYVFYVDYDNNHDILITDYIGGVLAGDFGVMGLFFMLLIVIAFSFAGLYNPAVALSMTIVALVIGLALGIMTISYGALISIVLVIIIAISRVKS